MGIWGYLGRETGRFVAGLAGALLLAAAVAALSEPGANAGFAHYLTAFFARTGGIAHLEFGISAITANPVIGEIARSLPITFTLLGAGSVVAVAIGIPAGVLFGTGRFLRRAAPLIQVVTALPLFCAALLAIWLAQRYGAAQSYAAVSRAMSQGDFVAATYAIAVPALIAGASAAAAIQLALHRAVLGAMREPFYEDMRRMGLSGFEIDRAFLTPYLLIGFFKALGEVALALFTADAVVEWTFDWPGVVNLFLHSIALRDWNVSGLVLLVVAGVVMAADFVGQTIARVIEGPAP